MQSSGASRIDLAWTRVRDSLWFIPSIAVAFASVLAVFAVGIPNPSAGSGLTPMWLFSGGAEGARGVLTAIAGGLISVTGTIFSVTIVALQLASSQFTPRVLGSFMADRVNQSVLGVFIGTFTYTLLVLRTIHSEGQDRSVFVPQVGITIALGLLLVSIGALIVFINHAAQSIRVSVILSRESRRTLERVEQLFPRQVGWPASADAAAEWAPPGPAGVVVALESGYLQAVHAEALWRLSDEEGRREPIAIRMEMHVGAFTFPGKALASVWPARLAEGAVARAVRRAFVLGPERTSDFDVEFGLVELSDIAVKALSPSINDPTTAMHCIDRLSELLSALGTRRQPNPLRSSADGRVRLLVRDTPFERSVGVAFDQIRHFGANNPTIVKKLLEALSDLAAVVDVQARPALRAQVHSVLAAARRAIDDPGELAAIERLAAQPLYAPREDERV